MSDKLPSGVSVSGRLSTLTDTLDGATDMSKKGGPDCEWLPDFGSCRRQRRNPKLIHKL